MTKVHLKSMAAIYDTAAFDITQLTHHESMAAIYDTAAFYITQLTHHESMAADARRSLVCDV
jgi:hypothetical protein